MAEQGKTEQEPSIEEILASIRQIISDDEDGAAGKEAPNAPMSQPQEDVIELVDRVEEEPKDFKTILAEEQAPVAKPEPVPEPPRPAPPPPPPAPEPAKVYAKPDPIPEPEELEVAMNDISARMNADDDADTIFTDQATSAALGAFSELVARTAIDRSSGVTLEEMVRDMMKPMLRAWIDKNVPKIVERLLSQELERISRRVLDE